MNTLEAISIKNGIEKIKKIIGNTSVGMLATNLTKIPFSICPMTTQEIDKRGDIWVFSNKDSQHFKDIQNDNRVQLIYANPEKQQYLSLFGNAIHVVDEAKVQKLWNPGLKKWFKGKDDPKLALLDIDIEIAHFWDSNKEELVPIKTSATAKNKNDTLQEDKGSINLQTY